MLRKLRLKFMQIRTILYQYIKTLIKHVFLLNFTHELLMSFRSKDQIGANRSYCNHLACSNNIIQHIFQHILSRFNAVYTPALYFILN